jgi:putative proteasome-type protease
MTYCVAIKLNAGLVLLSDSRTNAGVDHISTFRKMTVIEKQGDRVITLLSSGNLAITQAVRHRINQGFIDEKTGKERNLWNASTMFDVATLVGDAVRAVAQRETQPLNDAGIDFNMGLLLSGQIAGEEPRLFQVYAAGNFIEATDDNYYFQIGEAKYGKPILDRVLTLESSLEEAVKCALISMDSTLKSNLSVGMPLDLLVYQTDSLHVSHITHIDERNEYFKLLRDTWGRHLRQVFTELETPKWLVLDSQESHYMPLFDAVQAPSSSSHSFSLHTAILSV